MRLFCSCPNHDTALTVFIGKTMFKSNLFLIRQFIKIEWEMVSSNESDRNGVEKTEIQDIKKL